MNNRDDRKLFTMEYRPEFEHDLPLSEFTEIMILVESIERIALEMVINIKEHGCNPKVELAHAMMCVEDILAVRLTDEQYMNLFTTMLGILEDNGIHIELDDLL